MAEILVVEDYPPMASMLMRMLRTRAHQVVRELTVSGAMQHDTRFDYAVLDIDLPDGNGVALAEHLLAHRRVSQVVFFTATREASTLSRAAQLGPVVDKAEGLDQVLVALEQLMPCATEPPPATTAVSEPPTLFCLSDSVEPLPRVAVHGF